MWRGEIGRTEYLVNVMWPFTDYTADNGATLIWQNSHGERALEPEPSGDPVGAEMRPGAALLFLGSPLHDAGANAAAPIRRRIIVDDTHGWRQPPNNKRPATPAR